MQPQYCWEPLTSCQSSDGDVAKVDYFLDITISIADSELKIKSLYSNDLILNIASTSKETVQTCSFLEMPYSCIVVRNLSENR